MRSTPRDVYSATPANVAKSFPIVRFEVDTDSLVIKDVTEEDEGTYTCIMNTTLDRDSASATLTVVGTFALYFARVHFECREANGSF